MSKKDRKRERKSARARAAFVAGRDLAVAMLREGVVEPQGCIEPRHRCGLPQSRVVLDRLERVMAEPHLAPGFAAVLTDLLFTAVDLPDLDRYQLDAADMLDVPKRWRGLTPDEAYELETLRYKRRCEAERARVPARAFWPTSAEMPGPDESSRH